MNTYKFENLFDYYVPPHHKKSEPITKDSDFDLIISDAELMIALCYMGNGEMYQRGYALAHCQINDKNPMAFFVTREGQIIINPEIMRHTKATIMVEEACLSFPDREKTPVGRHHKIVAHYQTLDENGELTGLLRKQLKGFKAQVWQHEVDHINGLTIYDDE